MHWGSCTSRHPPSVKTLPLLLLRATRNRRCLSWMWRDMCWVNRVVPVAMPTPAVAHGIGCLATSCHPRSATPQWSSPSPCSPSWHSWCVAQFRLAFLLPTCGQWNADIPVESDTLFLLCLVPSWGTHFFLFPSCAYNAVEEAVRSAGWTSSGVCQAGVCVAACVCVCVCVCVFCVGTWDLRIGFPPFHSWAECARCDFGIHAPVLGSGGQG